MNKVYKLTPISYRKGLTWGTMFFLFVAISVSWPSRSLAQELKTLKGNITNKKGESLVGVSIQVQNTTVGTLTDTKGDYQLFLPVGGDTLIVSYLGYQSQEIPINNRAIISIVLTPGNQQLNEVVVTGYTTQLRKDISGSISTVNTRSLQSLPSSSAMRALQGQASGVVVSSSGVPGSASTISIRGISSFGSTQPLVLIDGVVGSLDDVSAEDIESIQVLKDAGAAAIYGVRASNGVILVTTKKGKKGQLKVSYNGYFGFQLPRMRKDPLNVMNTPEYMSIFKTLNPSSLLNEMPDFTYRSPTGTGVGNIGNPAVNPTNYVLNKQAPLNSYVIQRFNKTGTDWYHAFFKPAPITSHNISVSGGSNNSTYLFSLNYLNQQGTIIETSYKRYSARINTQFKIGKHVQIGENAYLTYEQPKKFTNQQDFASMAELYQMLPMVPLYDIKGNFAGTSGGPDLGSRYNPVADQLNTGNNRYNTWGIAGNTYAQVDFLKHFNIRTSFGGNISNSYAQDFSFVDYWNAASPKVPVNRYTESASYSTTTMWTNTMNYENTIGKNNNIKIIAGSEAIRNYGRDVGGSSNGFFSTNFNYLILGNGTTNVTNFSGASTNTLFSLFGELLYNYNQKYLFTATLRKDGSSMFGPQKRYGLFPSFSLGWVISNESFMKNLTWIDNLKVRGSYGILGSENNVNPNNSFSLFGGGFSNAYYAISGSNSLQQGFIQTQVGNPVTGWEQDKESDIGFDAVIFHKLTLSLDIYKKAIGGLLFAKPLPATAVGAVAVPTINVGNIQNVGYDVTIGYSGTLISPSLRFSINGNISGYKNTIKSIPDPGYFDIASQQQLGNMVRNEVGHPIGSFFGYKVIGIFNSQDEINKSPTQQGAAVGRFKYKDINGDGVITPADRTFIGNPNPKFTYGLNAQLEYKGFDLTAFFYGSQGNDIINTIKVNSDFFGTYLGDKSKVLLNAWTPTHTDTKIPKVELVNSFSTAGTMNSYFVENGSYLRLKSTVLGYSFNTKLFKSLNITRLRLYLQITNLFTITKYTGLDPELTGPNSDFGIDWGNYPDNQKNFIFGVTLSF